MAALVQRLTGGTAPRQGLALLIAVPAGLAIAWIDSRPSWNDTGVTAIALLAAAFAASVVARRRPWLWALLVGIWLPLIEIPASGQPASLVALVFAGLGATGGRLVSERSR